MKRILVMRYCVNERRDVPTPRVLYPKVHPLLVAFGHGNYGMSGLMLRPAIVLMSAYQHEYSLLRQHLAGLLAPAPAS